MVTDASFSGRLLLVLVLVVVCISAVVSDDVRKVRNAMRRREGMVRTKKIKQKVRRGNGRVGRLTVVILGCGRNRSLVSTVQYLRLVSFASFDVERYSIISRSRYRCRSGVAAAQLAIRYLKNSTIMTPSILIRFKRESNQSSMKSENPDTSFSLFCGHGLLICRQTHKETNETEYEMD
jgi:hypothetical protein